MTANQLEALKLKEQERANKAKEGQAAKDLEEKERSNKEQERLKSRDTSAKFISGALSTVGKSFLNDKSWYAEDPQLVKDAASLSYCTPLGKAFKVGAGHRYNGRTVPGVMRIGYIPTVGNTTSGVTTLTQAEDSDYVIAMQDLYAWIRHRNSGARNYERSDLAMYIEAISSLYQSIAISFRAYSLALTSKNKNYYYYKRMLAAAGFDIDDMDTYGLANFRMQVNKIIKKAKQFNLPAVMPLMQRRLWMTMNIFKDCEIHRSSEYIMLPDVYYVWSENGVGHLEAHAFPWACRLTESLSGSGSQPSTQEVPTCTCQQFFKILNDMLGAIVDSEDVGIISGDIAKAYGDESLFYLEWLTEDYHIESEYSEEVLSQIAGATACGSLYKSTDTSGNPTCISSWTLGQVNNNIVIGNFDTTGQPVSGKRSCLLYSGAAVSPEAWNSTSATSASLQLQKSEYFVDMYKDDVTPDDNMVATRLTAGYNAVFETTSNAQGKVTRADLYHEIVNFGTEVVTTLTVLMNLTVTPSGSTGGLNDTTVTYCDGMTIFGTSNVDNLQGLQILLTSLIYLAWYTWTTVKFDWGPRTDLFVINLANSLAWAVHMYSNYDLQNFALIADTTLQNMHTTATISLWGLNAIRSGSSGDK